MASEHVAADVPDQQDLPGWARAIAQPGDVFEGDEALLDATIELAVASAEHGGGPFGALIADDEHRIVALGWNRVIETNDSTAHAEIVALRDAQARLATHDLADAERAPLTLYASCAPCIQCFGAVWWSGLAHVVAAGSPEDAERLGFQEGPVGPELWSIAAREKGVRYEPAGSTSRDPREPFRVYERKGGQIY